MEPSPSSTVVSVITGIIQSLSIATTTLKPPPPDFQAEPYESYIYELDLSPTEIASIPEEIIAAWKDHIFRTRNTFKTLIPEDSLAGKLIEYAKKPISEMEDKVTKNVCDFYFNQTDEVDRIALNQIWSIFRWSWRRVGDYVAHNLVEGAFLGYNDQENFERATRFSFQRMMHHAARTDALRELTFHQSHLYFVRDRLPHIEKMVKQQSEKHKLWRYRWMTAEKVNILNVVLNFQLELYQHILATLPDNSSNELRYMVLKNHHKLNHILAEIKASYFNQMVKIKPKSWADQKCQDAVNWLADRLTALSTEPIISSRPFLEVYAEALNVIWEVYDQLLPVTLKERNFNDALSDFINAISADNFIQAKWISLTTLTPKTSFNWLEEAANFENYKRAIDRLIHIQNQMDELITHLHHINDKLFQANIDKNLDSNSLYIKVNNLIYSVWDLRNKIDELRIYYRMAYLKKLRTTVNLCSKDVWERVKDSIINKATRKILEGRFFDQTEQQEEVVRRLRGIIQHYEEKLSQIKLLISELPFAKDSPDAIPVELLVPVNRGEEFYPVFYTYSAYKKVFADKRVITAEIIQQTFYNLKRICRLMPQDEFWQQQRQEIEKYIHLDRQFEKLSLLVNIYSQMPGEHPLSENYKLLSHIRETAKQCREDMPCYFHKYVTSEWNRRTSLNLERVTSSLSNKASRLKEEGKLFDDTKEFTEIYPELMETLDRLARKLEDKISLSYQKCDGIMVGNILLPVPPQNSQPSTRSKRRDKRSRSLLLLEPKGEEKIS
ncbi:hypothetical protein [Candidatus Odyssella thessalonicensis]|uniref:hypothetical protein n=1 Tax=Candidatus Odyssella thessalonicensis TaxID=84647 RepID=UPI000225C09B|nr:hypothetical protein [Candidatus Odyssella thessalonicensis]